MNGPLGEAWAWVYAIAGVVGSWLFDLNTWVALTAIVVGVLTAIHKFNAIRLQRRKLAESQADDGW